jgi:hypothetical protein
MLTHTISVSSAPGCTTFPVLCAIALESIAKKRASKRRRLRGGVIARAMKRSPDRSGRNPFRWKSAHGPRRRRGPLDPASENDAGFFERFTDRGKREGSRGLRIGARKATHQPRFDARMQWRGSGRVAISKFDPAARKNEAFWQERVRTMPLSHQDFWLGPRAVDQNQGRGILRTQVGKCQLARGFCDRGKIAHDAFTT